MPTTYSSKLRVALIGAGEQSSIWGLTTNDNLGTLIEEAIAGAAAVSVTAASQALTANQGVTDEARQAVLVLTTTTGANFAVYAPPQEKTYLIRNDSSYTATVYCSTVLGNTTAAGAGVAIPAGKTMLLRLDGTVVYAGLDYLISPTLLTPALGTPASGVLTNCTGIPAGSISGTLPVANGGTGVTASTGTVAVVLSTSPTLVTPILGTPTSGTLTNCTGLPIAGTTGYAAGIATFLATPSSANLLAALTDETGTGAAVFATSPTLVTPVLGTPSSGTLSSCTGLPISTGVSGLGAGTATILAVADTASGSVGFRDIPQNAQVAGYTFVAADSGKHVYASSAGTFTIPANASVAFPIGTVLSLVNMNVGNCTIPITSDTMYLSGVGTTGTRTLAQYGVASMLKMTATTWLINGTNVT